MDDANAYLTEDAEKATAEAEAAADREDAGSTEDEALASGAPAFLEIVRKAREYTRVLLGLNDDALKTFKAKVEAARALAVDREEFKALLDAARAELDAALAAQREEAKAAREEHAEELAAIFDATTAVFKACAPNVEMAPHGHGHGRGDGRELPPPPPPRGDGPVVMIGDGEFRGGFGELAGKAHGKPGGRPPRPDFTPSAECTVAADALAALLPDEG